MSLSLAYFGTYDPTYPRNAVMLAGLRAAGVDVHEFNAPLAQDLTAARMTTAAGAARLALDLARAHVDLCLRHRPGLQLDVIVVGYPGHLMVPLARGVAAVRRAPLVFDPLVSLSDTFAGDRGLIAAGSPAAALAAAVDRLAFGLADLVLADTAAQAAFYEESFGVPGSKLAVVPVGALPVAGAGGAARRLTADEPLVVFLYGKWSPLHGVETVLAAAAGLRAEPFRFVLAGEGQLSASLRAIISAEKLDNVTWLGALSPAELSRHVLAADVCLGVFGGSSKAARVVPNKAVDALAAGRPLVTMASPAARELLTDKVDALLVPPLDSVMLTAALRRLRDRRLRARLGAAALRLYRRRLTPAAVADSLLAALERLA
jgi:glycosyltransferase involved in cell wall biosynthesis